MMWPSMIFMKYGGRTCRLFIVLLRGWKIIFIEKGWYGPFTK